MKVVRKWNPKSAPAINNPYGPKNYRLVALVKDDVHTHYACFFDMWTKKIYIELIKSRHSGTWDYSDFNQIETDEEWDEIIDYLSEPGVEVIQTIENKVIKGMSELAFHENMHKIPSLPYGVDANGQQIITSDTDTDMQISPTDWTDSAVHKSTGKIIV